MKKVYSNIKNWGHKELFTVLIDTLQKIWFNDMTNSPRLNDIKEKLYDTNYPVQLLNQRFFTDLNETEKNLIGFEPKYFDKNEFSKKKIEETLASEYNFLIEKSVKRNHKNLVYGHKNRMKSMIYLGNSYDKGVIDYYYNEFKKNEKITSNEPNLSFHNYFHSLETLYADYYHFENNIFKHHKTISDISKAKEISNQQVMDLEHWCTEQIWNYFKVENEIPDGALDLSNTFFLRPKTGRMIENSALQTIEKMGLNYKNQLKIEDSIIDISIFYDNDHLFDIECDNGRKISEIKKGRTQFLDSYFLSKERPASFIFLFDGIWTMIYSGKYDLAEYLVFKFFEFPSLIDIDHFLSKREYSPPIFDQFAIRQDGGVISVDNLMFDILIETDTKIQELLNEEKDSNRVDSLDGLLNNLVRKNSELEEETDTDIHIFSYINHSTKREMRPIIMEMEELYEFSNSEFGDEDELKAYIDMSTGNAIRLIKDYTTRVNQNLEYFRNPKTAVYKELEIKHIEECESLGCKCCFSCVKKEFRDYDDEQSERWAKQYGLEGSDIKKITQLIQKAQLNIEIIDDKFDIINVKDNFIEAFYNLIKNSFKHGYVDWAKNDNNTGVIKIKILIKKSKEGNVIYFLYSQNGKDLITDDDLDDWNINFWALKNAPSKEIGRPCGNYQTKKILEINGGSIFIIKPSVISPYIQNNKKYQLYNGLSFMLYVKENKK